MVLTGKGSTTVKTSLLAGLGRYCGPAFCSSGSDRMLGIVVVTQGNLAREFVSALEHVAGPQECVSTICIGADDNLERRRAEILECAEACDTGEGVIVLTDMLAARPLISQSRSWGRRTSRYWRE